MAEANNQRTNIGPILKNAERHDRVSSKFPLVEEEETKRGKSEHDEADDDG